MSSLRQQTVNSRNIEAQTILWIGNIRLKKPVNREVQEMHKNC